MILFLPNENLLVVQVLIFEIIMMFSNEHEMVNSKALLRSRFV